MKPDAEIAAEQAERKRKWHSEINEKLTAFPSVVFGIVFIVVVCLEIAAYLVISEVRQILR